MIAGKQGDPVLGVDIHMVIPPPPVPPPGPPTPLPHPFAGVVFDPLGALLGGSVRVNGSPAANTGTGVKGILHAALFIPPGVGPHPSDAPRGAEGTVVTGSKTVTFGGSSESRTASMIASCSYPIDLPTSASGAFPFGSPVHIGGPEAVDWEAAALTLLNSKWLSNKLHDIGKKALEKLLKNEEGACRNWLARKLLGHPVDAMTGELLANALDFEIPGLIPIRWERNYLSRQTREGALGAGWSHPFDELVEETRDGIKLWTGDGRPHPHRRLERGEAVWDAEDRFELARTELGYETTSWEGIRRIYRKPEGAAQYVLTEIRDRARNAIKLSYQRSYLIAIEDTAGRKLEVRWTRNGRQGQSPRCGDRSARPRDPIRIFGRRPRQGDAQERPHLPFRMGFGASGGLVRPHVGREPDAFDAARRARGRAPLRL
jgi:hypothetical protein